MTTAGDIPIFKVRLSILRDHLVFDGFFTQFLPGKLSVTDDTRFESLDIIITS